MSTHEHHLAALQSEIQTLEAENVAPKDWTLLGEASARNRPHDALLAHDLEFDRTTRAVPVVTEAVVAALEERIKARIKEGRFDDVVRRPAVGDAVPFLPSRMVELQDTKSAQSLAQIYEGAYVAAQSGTPVDDRDGRLKREHEEMTRVWEGICAKLDALCNAHYVPKPVRWCLSYRRFTHARGNSRKGPSRQSQISQPHPLNPPSPPPAPSQACSHQKKSSRPPRPPTSAFAASSPQPKNARFVPKNGKREGG